jgi:uncharacterized membrane protein YeaQ/YmgE (transglycosylase-associated protein family)
MGFIGFIVVGLIAGFIARAVVPGKDDLGILGTLILGIIGSIIGAIIALLVWRKVGGRSRV